jgi:hypothetical protein
MPNPHFQKCHFRPEQLEPPAKFYARELEGNLSRPNHSGWSATPGCPFHHSDNHGRKKSRPFAVRLDSGGFYCLKCGAGGTDIVAFIQLRDHLTFKEAAQKLGAWDAAPSPETVRRIAAADREREKKRRLDQDQREKEHAERIRVREQIHLAIQFQRDAERRLDELHAGAEPITANEAESCWAVMSLSCDYEREMAQEYRIAAGLETCYGE